MQLDFPLEWRGRIWHSNLSKGFLPCIDDSELVDYSLSGGKFTGSNGQNQLSTSRLDRFLVSLRWDEMSRIHHKSNRADLFPTTGLSS